MSATAEPATKIGGHKLRPISFSGAHSTAHDPWYDFGWHS